MYDIIGDVHGEFELLKKLLKQLGYVKSGGLFWHPERKAVFVGDFTNRGPGIRQTVQLIKKMVDEGAAFAILGNHEIYNILYHLKGNKKEPLLKQKSRRFNAVRQTVTQFKSYPEEWREIRKWLRTLPLFLELDGLRVVHAYWGNKNIEILKNNLTGDKVPKRIFRDVVLNPQSELSQAILQTTRGLHLIMPPDLKVFDHRKRYHRFFRIKWWQPPQGLTFKEWSFESKFRLPKYSIPPELYPDFELYPSDAPPVVFGHYCRGKGPYIIENNLCCVDACVSARKVLAAYRWSGEQILVPENLVMVR